MAELKTSRRRAVLIAGPTGSGKSRLAIALACAHNGVVINADAMQVYSEMRVLTARPSVEDESVCPHRLYGHVSVGQAYSVARWLRDVALVLDEAHDAGRLPVIVGGTGLYFKALCEGISPIPEIPETVRAFWRGEALAQSASALHDALAARDEVMASRLHVGDRQRVTRALEVIEGTGRSLAEWQEQTSLPLLAAGSFAGLVVDRPREEIYQACDARFEEMVERGALEEAGVVRDMQLDTALPGMRALGLASLIEHLDGRMTLDDAVAASKLDTRHYVKRQLTWLRRNMIAWKSINVKDMVIDKANLFAFIDG